MIIACPNCKSRFTVPDGAITPEGRKVRCATCKHVWRATPEDAVAPAPPPPPMPAHYPQMSGQAFAPAVPQAPHNPYAGQQPAAPEPVDPEIAARTAAIRSQMLSDDDEQQESLHASDDGLGLDEDGDDYTSSDDMDDLDGDDFSSTPDGMKDVMDSIRAAAGEAGVDADAYVDDDTDYDEDGDSDDALARMNARARRERAEGAAGRRRVVVTALWAVLVLIWLGVPILLFGFPSLVKSVLPSSQVLYDMLSSVSDRERFRAGAETLSASIADEPERIDLEVGEISIVDRPGGGRAVVVTGVIRNEGRRAARVPRLRLTIYDAANLPIKTHDFDPPGRLLTRGQAIPFIETVVPAPTGIQSALLARIDGEYSTKEAEERI